ncbi:MAG: IS1634 family transposase, partial [Kiritimatiellia bacterium]
MFLRRNRRRKNGETYEYWTLVETVRTARGPRQRIVATLGKLPGLDEDERVGWEEVTRLLDGHPRETGQGDLFRTPSAPPLWAQVDLSGVRVERVRDFGKVYVALALWRRLGLHQFFNEQVGQGREKVDWATVACILCVGRFCDQGSELALGERWYAHTALDDLLGVDPADVYDNRLYRGLDQMLPMREKLFTHLRERYESLFGSRFEFLLYDVTSTYFEGQCQRNPQARRGYSRDQRSDCKQVCIGLVVTPEGLPLAYEVFAGNRADVTTVEDIVDRMEAQYGRAERIWAMDRGMTSEDNLDYLRARGALYIVGTPKSQLRQFERELLEEADWQQVEADVEVKLLAHPGGQEQFVLCRSQARHEKEAAMFRRQRDRVREKLLQIDAGLRRHKAKPAPVERRIGKWLGRHTAAEKVFRIGVQVEDGWAVGLHIQEETSRLEWAQHAQGAYLLRTNCREQDPQKLWRWYIQLTEVEDAFRTSKSDLSLRPVYHQLEHRVQAHILICFIALAMWRSLEMWAQGAGMGHCGRQILKELDTIRSMDVVLPVRDKADVRLRVVSKPEKLAADLLEHLQLKFPNRPKIVQNVVEKNGT